jgi:hypothetical protein
MSVVVATNRVSSKILIRLVVLIIVLGNSIALSDEKTSIIPEFKWEAGDSWAIFYGQIDKGYLLYDDGAVTEDYWIVDNANSSTRAGIETYVPINDDLTGHGKIEGQWTPYSTGSVNLTNRGAVDWDSHVLRKAEIWLDHRMYGRFALGQGSMASDGSAEVDLSGTDVVGYSAIGDFAGGQLLREAATGLLSTAQVRDTFRNLDGLGRLLRVRYDTPSFEGIRLSTSIGTRVVPVADGLTSWDVAAAYEYPGKAGDLVEFESVLAYSYPGDGSDLVSGSASVLLNDRFNATMAAAYKSKSGIEMHYFYGKLGYIGNWLGCGPTAVSIDAYIGDNFNTDGSESSSFGVQVVQKIDRLNTETFFGVRHYDYSEPTVDYLGSLGVLTGVRVKF